MNICVVDPEEAASCLDHGKPAQENVLLRGHQRSRTPAAPVEEPNQTSSWRIGDRNRVMRAWSALAIAANLVAAPLHAQFVYVANFNSNNVSGYTIDPSTGVLTAIAGSPFLSELTPSSIAVDSSGKFGYVTNSYENNISGYSIDASTGALTFIAGSPFPAGANSFSVAVDPSGKFAYAANLGGNNVSGYRIDPSTGALVAIAGSPFPAGVVPISVAVDPSGKFAYVANAGGNVSGYRIDQSTGALTGIAGSPFPTGAEPLSVAVDPSGKFAYVANGGGNVSGYRIDPSTGALTAIAGSPFPAGVTPSSMAVAMTRLVPFASSSAKLEITAGPPSGFDLKESFTLGRNSNGIHPLTENVTLKIGTSSETIPTGSFKQIPHGRFSFQGVIKGVSLEVQIVSLGNNVFTFKAEGTGEDLTGLSNPVTVVLTIGDDTGRTSVIAQFQ
jgi:6-phosphogluconolactonase (cycloisomerase 2 family)